MTEQKFFYVSYIETTPEKLWNALTSSEFTRQYWMGCELTSDWKIGSPVKLHREDEVIVVGKILASERPKVLSYTWNSQKTEEQRAEKPSRVTFLLERLEPNSAIVKLTVTHDDFPANSKVFPNITGGWPMVLSNLKSLLENGRAMSLQPSCK